jgi:adenosylhomocysteine nucleosidase
MTCFVVALRAEARPLIERYQMKRLAPVGPSTRSAFGTYRGHGKTLVISGVGKVQAAAATAHLHAPRLAVWLNVGIAGHRRRAPGELVRANRITDAATGKRFYPTLVGLSHLDSDGVTTVEVAETSFASDDLYDMEASGFCEAALRHSTSELVQCVKIVSDNLNTGTGGLTSARVSELVHRHVDTIDAIVTHLESLATELEPLRREPDVEAFVDTWHFTTSERRRLSRLLERCNAFGDSVRADEFHRLQSASAVLGAIEGRLRALTMEQSGF